MERITVDIRKIGEVIPVIGADTMIIGWLRSAYTRMLGLINNMINALGKIRLTVDADYFQRLDPWHAILDCRSASELKRKSQEIFELNPSYLSRIFKKLMGIGFSDYLQWIRVREAEALLPNKKLSIREISELTGFGGVQTMNRAFKKHCGTTAGKMRQG